MIHHTSYTHYSLCSKCKKNLCPDPPGVCPSCQRKTQTTVRPSVKDYSAPPDFRNHATRKALFDIGGVQWDYPTERGGELCSLRFKEIKVSIWRGENRTFRYEIVGKDVLDYRGNIDNYAYAKLRALRHLARILQMDLTAMCAEFQKKRLKEIGFIVDDQQGGKEK